LITKSFIHSKDTPAETVNRADQDLTGDFDLAFVLVGAFACDAW